MLVALDTVVCTCSSVYESEYGNEKVFDLIILIHPPPSIISNRDKHVIRFRYDQS